jgi:glycogen phosphorylase
LIDDDNNQGVDMIERINSQTGFRASLLRTAQTALAEIPRRLHPVSRHTNSPIPTRFQSWHRVESERYAWLFDLAEPTLRERQETNHELLKVPGGAPRTDESELNPRQWLRNANPRLASLVSETIGNRWMTHLEDLQQLEPIADRPFFQARWRAVKRANKQILAHHLFRLQGIEVDVDSLFDVQIQSIDSHQRQLLSILHIITLFNRIKANPALDLVPRTFIFGDVDRSGSNAMPGQEQRTLLLLIKSLAKVLAADLDVKGRLQVVYVPQTAGLNDQLYAAADLTEQIAMAELEDIDPNKLKFATNGVLSIGSLGQANQIVQQAVGAENYFSFGLAIPEIAMFKEYGYDPYNYYKYYPEIRAAIDGLLSGEFTPEYPGACRNLIDNLLGTDENLVLADLMFYLACQARVSETYRQKSVWTRMSILNVAGVG